jgi:1-acyl-sn-glycerol-3-phosphate acyltransferase
MTMTTPEEPIPQRQRREKPVAILPPLNDATILRAREGLDAARDPDARAGANYALANAEQFVEGRADRRLNGRLRRFLLRLFIGSLFRVRVEHPEYIPTGPCMLAPNHLNHIDPFLTLSVMRAKPYFYVFGDARTMYNKRWKRFLGRLVGGVIPIDRMWKEEEAVVAGAKEERPDLAELAAAIEHDVPTGSTIDVLRQLDRIVQAIFARGDAILIFPEGGLGMQEGRLRLPLKRGTVIYALRAGVPIVPAALIGTRDLFLRKTLTVRLGKPLQFPQSNRPKPREVETALTALQQAIEDMLPKDTSEPRGPQMFHRTLNRMFW